MTQSMFISASMFISDLHVGDIVQFRNGDRVKITGLELTEGNERVRVTRYHVAQGKNITHWMKWQTFCHKAPMVVWYG